MKTLSIKQPWASLIAHGIKDIENRTWRCKYRGRIYIHASGKPSHYTPIPLSFEQYHFVKETNGALADAICDMSLVRSAIIGEVDIVDCVLNHPSIWAEKSYEPVNFNSLPFGEEDEKPSYVWNWILANPVMYDYPILNVKGALSLWEYERPYQVIGTAEMVEPHSGMPSELEQACREAGLTMQNWNNKLNK